MVDDLRERPKKGDIIFGTAKVERIIAMLEML